MALLYPIFFATSCNRVASRAEAQVRLNTRPIHGLSGTLYHSQYLTSEILYTFSPAALLSTSASSFGRLIITQCPPSIFSTTSMAVGSAALAAWIRNSENSSTFGSDLSSFGRTNVDGMYRHAAYVVVLVYRPRLCGARRDAHSVAASGEKSL